MIRKAIGTPLMVIVCMLLTSNVAAAAAPAPFGKGATTQTTAGVAFIAGKLEFTVVDDTVRLTARGDGWSSPWGNVVAARATWSPTLDKVMAFLAGQLDELSIATGTFSAEFASGDTIAGTIAGTIRPRDDGTFGLEAKFTATHGTGRFAGASGGGTLRAVEELESLEFRAMLNAKLNVTR